MSTSGAYRAGTGVVDMGDLDLLEPMELRRRLLVAFGNEKFDAPILPKIALDLFELSRRLDVTIPAIVHLLEQDPILAASVLRLAQSAAFSVALPVQSLQEALVRLGLETVRDLSFQVAVSARVFRAPGYDEPMDKLMQHSTAVAHVSRIVSKRTELFGEYAFLCGLLHDAGIAASLVVLANVPRGGHNRRSGWDRHRARVRTRGQAMGRE